MTLAESRTPRNEQSADAADHSAISGEPNAPDPVRLTLEYSSAAASTVSKLLPWFALAIASLGALAHTYIARLDEHRARHLVFDGTAPDHTWDPWVLARFGSLPLLIAVGATVVGWWTGTRYLAFNAPALAPVPSYVAPFILALVVPLFRYRLAQARVSCLSWRGEALRLEGSAVGYAGLWFALTLLTVVTLGYCAPIRRRKLDRYWLTNLWLGERKLNLEAIPIGPHFLRFAIGWSVCLTLAGCGILIATMTPFGVGLIDRVVGMLPDLQAASTLLAVLALLVAAGIAIGVIGLALLPYRRAYLSDLVGALRFGNYHAALDQNDTNLAWARVSGTIAIVGTLGLGGIILHARAPGWWCRALRVYDG